MLLGVGKCLIAQGFTSWKRKNFPKMKLAMAPHWKPFLLISSHPSIRRFLPRLLCVLCLMAVCARPASAQSLLDAAWLAAATPAEVQTLLDRGADLAARTESGLTPLHVAAASSSTPAVIGLLLDRGAALEARTETGRTPLHWAAAQNPAPAVIGLLLDRGADAKRRTAAGKLPVDLAAKNVALTGTAAYRRLHEASFEARP